MRTNGIAGAGRRRRGWLLAVGCLVVATTLGPGARAQETDDGTPSLEFFASPTVVEAGELTEARPYLVAEDEERTEITPILTSGEVVGDYQMAGTPDGLGLTDDDDDEVTLFVTHRWRSEDDAHLSDARVSRLTLDPENAAVLAGSYPIDGSEGYWDLSSGSLAGSAAGFADPRFLAGEASTESDQGGVALALDAATGDVTELPWFGFLQHESHVALPGFDDAIVTVIVDGDPEGSELYLYVAEDADEVLSGGGRLYVFVADGGTNPAELEDDEELSGSFVPIEREQNDNAATLQRAADTAGAFAFVRLGDVAYDRETPSTLYLTDTGVAGDEPETALDATPAGAASGGNGRLYRVELDPDDPTQVTSLSVLLDGDDGDDFRNPDDIDASESTIMIQENLGEANRAAGSEETARVLAYDLDDDDLTVVAQVDQSDDPDRLVEPADEAGSWPSTGVVNAADVFGEGAWLVAVQAPTLEVAQFDGIDEGGQLLLLRYEEEDATPVASTPRPVATAPPVATAAPIATAIPPSATTEPTAEPTLEPTAEPTEVPTDVPPTATEEPPPTATEEPLPTATEELPPTATEEVPPTATEEVSAGELDGSDDE